METARRFSQAISVIMFSVMFLSVLGQAFFRYVLNLPVGWAVEVALNSFLVGAWWTISWRVALADHVKFDLIYKILPPGLRPWCRLTGGVVSGALLLAALPAAMTYVKVMNRITTGVLKIPLSWVYWVFILFLVVMAARLFLDAFRSAGQIVRGGDIDP